MENPYKIQAMEWLERGRHDIEMAIMLFDNEGYTDTIGFLLQQGIEKCLKGLFVVNGIEPTRTHDLKVLLNKVNTYLENSENYYEVCLIATKYYIEGRYPPGPLVLPPRDEISVVLSKANMLMGEVKSIIEKS